MKFIKHFFASKKKKSSQKPDQPAHVSEPVDGSFEKVTPEGSPRAVYPPQVSFHRQRSSHYSAGNATLSFIPQEYARNETMAWLNSGTSNALESLLTERDRAAKQVQRGPMTKGTNEVQLILNEPSCKSADRDDCSLRYVWRHGLQL